MKWVTPIPFLMPAVLCYLEGRWMLLGGWIAAAVVVFVWTEKPIKQ